MSAIVCTSSHWVNLTNMLATPLITNLFFMQRLPMYLGQEWASSFVSLPSDSSPYINHLGIRPMCDVINPASGLRSSRFLPPFLGLSGKYSLVLCLVSNIHEQGVCRGERNASQELEDFKVQIFLCRVYRRLLVSANGLNWSKLTCQLLLDPRNHHAHHDIFQLDHLDQAGKRYHGNHHGNLLFQYGF